MNVPGVFYRVVAVRTHTIIALAITITIVVTLISSRNCKDGIIASFSRLDERPMKVTQSVLVKSEKDLPAENGSPKTKKKTILYWTKMFDSENFYFGNGDVFAGCPVANCIGTNDRKYQPLDQFDAVMFHGPELNHKDLPEVRSPGQKYIFMDLETPVLDAIPRQPAFENFFNWTMTYRRDSDIMRPYGVFVNASSNEIIAPYMPIQWIDVSGSAVPENLRFSYRNKTKMAAWFVSHCRTDSKREEVAKKLQDYVQVDVYGQCGKFECPRTTETQCYRKLESEYFFYLSFENSMCEDYLTEKIYSILGYDIVPIVYGAADYASFLPPKSYINVLDFSSIKELADFIVELSKDEERYLGYFKWKNFYKTISTRRYIVCEFCRALHQRNWPEKTVANVYDWWTKGPQCRPPPKLS